MLRFYARSTDPPPHARPQALHTLTQLHHTEGYKSEQENKRQMDVGKRPPSHLPPPLPNLSYTLVVYFFKYNRQKKKINLVDLWYASGGANKPIGFTCTKKDVLHYESTVQVLHAASAQLHSRQPVLPVVL